MSAGAQPLGAAGTGWPGAGDRITICVMSVITFRADDEVDHALAELSGGDRDRSQVIREAILAAWRARRDEQLRAEAEAVAADPDDQAEGPPVTAGLRA